MHTATANNAALGGVVAGVLLFEVCVWLVVRLRQRMKEPAATKEKKGFWYVIMIIHYVILM